MRKAKVAAMLAWIGPSLAFGTWAQRKYNLKLLSTLAWVIWSSNQNCHPVPYSDSIATTWLQNDRPQGDRVKEIQTHKRPASKQAFFICISSYNFSYLSFSTQRTDFPWVFTSVVVRIHQSCLSSLLVLKLKVIAPPSSSSVDVQKPVIIPWPWKSRPSSTYPRSPFSPAGRAEKPKLSEPLLLSAQPLVVFKTLTSARLPPISRINISYSSCVGKCQSLGQTPCTG